MPGKHYDHERGEDMGRRSTDCPVEGCPAVVLNNTKLTWVLSLIAIFGSIGCGLLGVQSYQIPSLRAELLAQGVATEKRVVSVENQQKRDEDNQTDDRAAIRSLEESVYTNQAAIKKVARPIHTTTTIRDTKEIYMLPITESKSLQPLRPLTKGGEIWK